MRRKHLNNTDHDNLKNTDTSLTNKEVNGIKNKLNKYTIPPMESGKTENLIHMLKDHMPEPESFRSLMEKERINVNTLRYILSIVRPQVNLVQPFFWVTSLFLILLAVFYSISVRDGNALPLILIAPPIAGLGISYMFRADNSIRQMEKSSTLGLYETSLGRIFLVIGYDIVLLLAAIIILWITGIPYSPVFLMMACIGPLFFISWVGLYLSVRFGSQAGFIGIVGGWASLILLGTVSHGFNLADLLAADYSMLLMIALFLMGLTGIAYTMRLMMKAETDY